MQLMMKFCKLNIRTITEYNTLLVHCYTYVKCITFNWQYLLTALGHSSLFHGLQPATILHQITDATLRDCQLSRVPTLLLTKKFQGLIHRQS